MASLAFDSASGFYRIVFWFGGKQYRRSLKTGDEKRAAGICGRVEETISLIQTGRITVPPEADPGTFILSDGKLDQKPVTPPPGPDKLTIADLTRIYEAELPAHAKEKNSLRTEHIHLRHVARILGADKPLDEIDLGTVQRYAKARGKETHGKNVKRPIRPSTVRKELKSFRHVWAWCRSRTLVPIAPTWELTEITLPRDREPEPFRTMAEIQERIERGGLSPAEQKYLWDGLYLTAPEMKELLDHVRTVDLEGFVHPMFAFAIYTGCRRSEMMRSHIDDFDFKNGRVQIREKKRVKGKTSIRWVDLHPELSKIMRDWFTHHPGGQFTLTQPDGSPLNVDLMDHRFDAAVRGTKFASMKGIHAIRHSFCSVLASRGVDQRIINSFVGHMDEKTAARYRHLIPATTKSAILQLMG